MSLYNRCLLTIIKNDVEVDVLPNPLLEGIKQLQSLHQTLNLRKQIYNLYYNSLSYIGQLILECLTCVECEQNCHSPEESGYCFTHSEMIDYKLAEQKVLKECSVNTATIYIQEKMRWKVPLHLK